MQSINVDRKCERIVGLLMMALNNERAGLTVLSLIQEATQLGDELYQYQQAKETMSAAIDWRIGEYEQFRFLTRLFDVCAAKRQIATHPRQIFGLPMDTFKSWVGAPEIVWLEPDENGRRMADNDSLGMISIDWDRAKEADLSVPVIVAHMIEDDSSVHSLVIDGWHRIARATLEGIDVLPAVVLLPNETAEIMDKQEKKEMNPLVDHLESYGWKHDLCESAGFVSKEGEFWPVKYQQHQVFASDLNEFYSDPYHEMTGWIVISHMIYAPQHISWSVMLDGGQAENFDLKPTPEQLETLYELAKMFPDTFFSKEILRTIKDWDWDMFEEYDNE